MATQNPQAYPVGAARPAGDGDFNVHVRASQDVRDLRSRLLRPPLRDCRRASCGLNLAELLAAGKIVAIQAARKMSFHVGGLGQS